MSKPKRLRKSFLQVQGLPIWEKAKWVNVNSKDMVVVPLLNDSKNSKCIVGVVVEGKITAVVVELSKTRSANNRIFSLKRNRVLYENGKLRSFIKRTKSDDTEDNSVASEQAAEDWINDKNNSK